MNSDYIRKISELRSKIKSFPDFPKEGILFWDIFSALSDGSTCKLIQNLLVDVIRTKYPDVEAVVGLEARGFLFSFSVAAELGIACLPIRKKGKLPGNVISYKYDLEYGSDVLELQKDTVHPGLKCVIIDDLIATGGSIAAAAELLRTCGANVIGSVVIIELLPLNGRENIPEGTPLGGNDFLRASDVAAAYSTNTWAADLHKVNCYNPLVHCTKYRWGVSR